MWVKKIAKNKFKYTERYTDIYTEKYRNVSVTLNSNSRIAWNEAQRILNKKIDDKLNEVKQSNITFKELLEKWQPYYKNIVKDSTYLRATQSLVHIKNTIEDEFMIRNIDSTVIQKLLDEMYYDKELSYSTVKGTKSLCNSIFDYARSRKMIMSNPVSETRIVKKPVTFDKVQKIENKFLEPQELRLILDTQRNRLKNSSSRYADFYEFLSLTGLRYGECAALKETNLSGNVLEIDGTLDYHGKNTATYEKTTPKNVMSYRKIELSTASLDIINRIIAENEILKLHKRYKDDNYIFTTGSGSPISLNNLNTNLRKIQEATNITKNLSTHIFRHTHISFLSEKLVPLKDIMKRVGHSKPNTTLEIYTHVTEQSSKNLLEKLNEVTY